MQMMSAAIRASRSLSARLALYMAVALIPIGLLMVLQTRELQGEAQRRSEAALAGEVMETLRAEASILMRAQGVVRALSLQPIDVLMDDAACGRVLSGIIAANPEYAAAAFVRADGMSTCNSTGQAASFADSPNFARRMASNDFAMYATARSPLTGLTVLAVSHVVRDEIGAKVGYIGVSVPYSQLIRMTRGGQDDDRDAFVVVYDDEGDILTAIHDQDDVRALLPRDRALLSLLPDRAQAFTTTAQDGSLRTYAAVSMIPGELFALGTWAANSIDGASRWDRIGAIPLVVAMWVGSLVVAILAGEVLVARHVRSLRRSVADFARGSRRVTEVEMAGAPRELVELADSYGVMVDTILQDEAALEDMVHQKEVLLREVHHRVKNNLQLIASIMNMQMRQARSPEARELMKGLHDRVMSLATVHRGLYQTSGLTDVRANELMDDILRQLVRMAATPGRQFALDLALEPIRLTPDQAVPLALFLTEAVTNALKYAPPGASGGIALSVALRQVDAAQVELVVLNPTGPGGKAGGGDAVAGDQRTGLGSQLLRAFAMQLGGTLTTEATDGQYRVALTFPLRALDEAEARHPAVQVPAPGDAG
ncbi:MAG: sensor histidine kinase [Gemmobacter sp.]